MSKLHEISEMVSTHTIHQYQSLIVFRNHSSLIKVDERVLLWSEQCACWGPSTFNTLRPRQNGRHFPDDIFEYIFLKENVLIPIKISLKIIPKSPINNIPALVQIMAWYQPGDKPLSEQMVVILLTHICITQPQWVKCLDICRHCDHQEGWYRLHGK